jgi:hypothetical protein
MGSASANKLQSGDNLSDPKIARLMKRSNLEDILSDMQDDNPLTGPDRPHAPPPVVVATASAPPAHEPQVLASHGATLNSTTADVSPQSLAPAAQTPPAQTPVVIEPAASVDLAAPATSAILEEAKAPQPEPPVSPPLDEAADREAMSRTISQEEPRGRGRPLKAKNHKSETSYSLDPELIIKLRKLSAAQQMRLGRTVSTSEIVEILLNKALQQITDDVVLAA